MPGAVPSQPSYVESRRAFGDANIINDNDNSSNHLVRDLGNTLRPTASSTSLYTPAFTRPSAHLSAQRPQRKHALDEDMESGDEKEAKKSRLEGELSDYEDQEEWHGSEDDIVVDEVSPVAPKRGSKRVASLEEDDIYELSQLDANDRRPRKLTRHGGHARLGRDAESEPIPRGKKRDRVSSFGGDESFLGEEGEKPRRHRRRRVLSHKKSEDSRGRKRGRDLESSESDGDESDSPSKRAVRHKRGKKTASRNSEPSAEDGMVSTDPLCRGRRIGEEWEATGVRYKVGPNGQRLRQALVKKTRSRFPMPKDSEHPDRSAHIDVFVEEWLPEEEYQTAKERHELSWQHSPTRKTPPTESISRVNLPDSPSKGKNLLWSSTTQKDSPARRGPFRQSLVPNASLRVIPTQQIQAAPPRRISTINSNIGSLPESPKLSRSSRSYSKWEKQDLEAAAMAKLREKVKQEAAPAPEKTAPVVLSGFSTPNVSAPSNSASKPTEPSAASKPANPFSFVSPVASTAPKASTSDLPALTIPATAKPKEAANTSTISFPSTNTHQPTEPSKPATGFSAPSSFSFGGKPTGNQPAASSSAPALTANGTASNLFTPGTSTAPVAATASNIFGSASQQNAASTTQVPKTFSFGVTGADQSKKVEAKPAEPASAAGSSLLARMGGSSSAPSPDAHSTASTTAATNAAPAFPFGKPTVPAVSAPAPAPAPVSSNPAASSGSFTSAPLKFNFGVSSKPASSASTPAAMSTTSAPSAEPSKPVTFAFGPPKTPAPAVATAPSNSTADPPKFAFGAPAGSSNGSIASSSSVFGGNAAPSIPKEAMTTPKAASGFGSTAFSTPASSSTAALPFGNTTTPAGEPKIASAFSTTTPAGAPKTTSFFSSTTPAGEPKTTSLFGNTTTTPAGEPKTSSPFGNTTGSSSFMKPALGGFGNMASGSGTSSVFGQTSTPAAAPAQAAESSKSAFSFGAPGASAAPVTPVKSDSQPKTTFSFGTGASNNAPTNGTATTSSPFSFGATAAPSTGAFGSSSTPSTGAFGSKPAPSTGAFGSSSTGAFGATSTGAFGSSSTGAFGPTSTGAFGSNSTPSTNVFGATSAVGSTSTPAFGSATQPTPNAFGFGAPSSGAFGFGKPNTDSTQK
ncbi:hypothetical protein EW026_g4413 [Hermanssonia centrifuga]|uniref:Uncharacterized protein n=1 Tax=Hermanssonia centrifuga TaxID=98765 RepID=A0A4S4KI04_9APHY|nr:hypothetical protein EW026_g4413 [Hermanssonia centrifuga]